eukprot:NODE_4270_length_835_cov_30.128499_g3944_i0.p1 GENE.NODE_4270_length_835_cov_30.128499_g3944_i0~~NODE_4270_length_835_cov_30.128499_g3944_i0.p1  ORF type:complete len:152 (+),score=22.00 NODE_4270_length_835_cov_30.128499_g3944_i0:244-699(+)
MSVLARSAPKVYKEEDEEPRKQSNNRPLILAGTQSAITGDIEATKRQEATAKGMDALVWTGLPGLWYQRFHENALHKSSAANATRPLSPDVTSHPESSNQSGTFPISSSCNSGPQQHVESTSSSASPLSKAMHLRTLAMPRLTSKLMYYED